MFRLPFEKVLYDISYANLILYGASLPSYMPKKDGKEKQEEGAFRADDPGNRGKLDEFFNSIRN